MIKCSVCGYDNPEDSQTCLNCGSPIERPKLGQAIDDISGEATVLIGTPLVPPPAAKPSATANPVPAAPRPAAPPPPPPPPVPAAPPAYTPSAPPPPAFGSPSGVPQQSHSMPPPAYASGDVESAKKFGYISLGLAAGSFIFCCLGRVIPFIGCLAIFELIGGLVVGIIGLKKAGTDQSARQLNIAGIAVNGILIAIFIVLLIVGLIVGGIAAAAIMGGQGSN